MTRNELYDQISELISVGAVPYEITPKTRNKLLDEIIVEYGGVSSINLTRNEMLKRILALAPAP
jgi:hypothetical protein